MPNICLDLPPKPYAQQDSGGGDGGLGGPAGSSNSIGGSGVNRGSSSGNGSGSAYNEDGVTSTATNSLSHGQHRELPTVSTNNKSYFPRHPLPPEFDFLECEIFLIGNMKYGF